MVHRGGRLTLLRRWLPGADAGCVDPARCSTTAAGQCPRLTAVWETDANEDYLHAGSETRRSVDALVRQLVVRPESVRATWSVARRCWTTPLITAQGVGELDYAFEPAADHLVVTRLAV